MYILHYFIYRSMNDHYNWLAFLSSCKMLLIMIIIIHFTVVSLWKHFWQIIFILGFPKKKKSKRLESGMQKPLETYSSSNQCKGIIWQRRMVSQALSTGYLLLATDAVVAASFSDIWKKSPRGNDCDKGLTVNIYVHLISLHIKEITIIKLYFTD